jgi:hypothetical protein
MDMNGSGRWWTELGSTLEASAAALAGFLAGQAMDGEWPMLEMLLRLVLGQ